MHLPQIGHDGGETEPTGSCFHNFRVRLQYCMYTIYSYLYQWEERVMRVWTVVRVHSAITMLPAIDNASLVRWLPVRPIPYLAGGGGCMTLGQPGVIHVSASSCIYPPPVFDPGSGHIGQGRFVLRTKEAASKNFRSGTHRWGTHCHGIHVHYALSYSIYKLRVWPVAS